MARRLAIHSEGLVISKPGVDALFPGNDDNLLFSMARRNLMQIGSGTFVMSPGVRINFGVQAPDPPLVFCRRAGDRGTYNPTQIAVDSQGFTAHPYTAPTGAVPANGTVCLWVAFMRSQL